MNMDLDWTTQIAKMNSTIGMYRHMARTNDLTAEQTVTLFNTYLRPKLEYRMRFMTIQEDQLKQWDRLLKKEVSDKVYKYRNVKHTALTLVMGYISIEDYYYTTQATEMYRTMNEGSDMGNSTRSRMTDRGNGGEQKTNRIHTQYEQAKERGFILVENSLDNVQVPTEIDEDTEWKKVRINGRVRRLPMDHFGTWGEQEETEKIRAYTDGSLHKRNQEERNRAGWGAFVQDDWYQNNWRRLHETKHEGLRRRMIREKVHSWGGTINRANSSYATEIEAIAKMLMIVPVTWELEIITDSQSAIDAIETVRRIGTNEKDNEWQMMKLIKILLDRRKTKVRFTHQKSHKKLHTIESVGNATADLLAEDYTMGITDKGNTCEIPITMTAGKYMMIDMGEYDGEERDGEGPRGWWVTGNIRKKVTRRTQETAASEKKWKETSTQGRLKGQIEDIRKYIKYRKTKQRGTHMDTLTRLITTVHTQDPVKNTFMEGAGKCDFCRIVKML
jgi:hypothetical protein